MAENLENDAFIVYAPDDEEWVNGVLIDAFNEFGIKHKSSHDLYYGVPELQGFEKLIASSKHVILVVSGAYKSDSLNFFVDVMSQTRDLEIGNWNVIPILLDSVQLPIRLRSLHPVDAASTKNQNKVITKLCQQVKGEGVVSNPKPLPDCPYKGMLPYEEEDKDNFYGRDDEIVKIINYLELNPVVAVIGPSGSGKSSLVRAGILPRIRMGASIGKSYSVRIFRFGGSPDVDVLSEYLDVDSVDEEKELLLFIDQFEELFNVESEQYNPILARLEEFINKPRCSLIFTVRADYYAELMESCLWSYVQYSKKEIDKLSENDLKDAIRKPAEKAGVYIQAALVEKLVAEAGRGKSVLPFLQETMRALWRKVERRYISRDAYESLILPYKELYKNSEVSGFEVTMSRYADRALGKLTEAQKNIARRVFLQLVAFNGNKAHARRQQSRDSLKVANDEENDFQKTIDTLVKSRLLVLSQNRSEKIVRVDISHEALIKGWQQFQSWLKKYTRRELLRRMLQVRVRSWEQLGEKESGLLDAGEYSFFDKKFAEEGGKDELPSKAVKFLDASKKNYNPGWSIKGMGILLGLLLFFVAGGISTFYLLDSLLSYGFRRQIEREYIVQLVMVFLFIGFLVLIYRDRFFIQKITVFLEEKRGKVLSLAIFLLLPLFYFAYDTYSVEESCSVSGMGKNYGGPSYIFDESSLTEEEEGIFTSAFRKYFVNFSDVISSRSLFDECRKFVDFDFKLKVTDDGSGAVVTSVDGKTTLPRKYDPLVARANSSCEALYKLASSLYERQGFYVSFLDRVDFDSDISCRGIRHIANLSNSLFEKGGRGSLSDFENIHYDYGDNVSLAYMIYISVINDVSINENMLNKDVDDPYLNYLMGEYFLSKGRLDKAIRFYEKSIDMEYPWGFFKLSYAYFSIGKADDAKKYFNLAVNRKNSIIKGEEGGYLKNFLYEKRLRREELSLKVFYSYFNYKINENSDSMEFCDFYYEYGKYFGRMKDVNGLFVYDPFSSVCN